MKKEIEISENEEDLSREMADYNDLIEKSPQKNPDSPTKNEV